MSSSWKGSVFFSDRVFAYLGAVGVTNLHVHHAVQIALARGGSKLEMVDRAGSAEVGSAFVIPADTHHAIRAPCPWALLLYVDPESDVGASLQSLVGASGSLGWRTAAQGLPSVGLDDPRDLRRATERLLLAFEKAKPVGATSALHPAIRDALELLPSLVRAGSVRARDIARRVGMSESRLMHLFREQIGMPLRPYVRWLRLKVAAEQVRRGANLTEAAHAAGFTDSAHLSNVFHATFGLTPSEIARGTDWVE
ncbi:helix-turn-helix domain-containing protein [Pendulispora albinea]|uniref:Helix-turn-helix transcriptional regulator n=1 Tax=Pendulispora albinea TaxID=2741071 RepID=A0ABZ2LZ75_9BACT